MITLTGFHCIKAINGQAYSVKKTQGILWLIASEMVHEFFFKFITGRDFLVKKIGL